jgi:adenylate cyclase
MSKTTTSDSTERDRDRRKLMAVLYADMVGYSRLIELDDAGTLQRLRALRLGLIDPAIDAHGGRLVQTGGDSLLIAFDSIDVAVRCGIKVQRQLPEFDSDHFPDRAIRFRVGINFGDVIAEGDDLHGEMVNVAARLQAECPPGGICVTLAVRDHVQSRLDLVFEELGPIKLKNIARPVEAFVLRLDGTSTAQKRPEALPSHKLGNIPQPGWQSTAGLADAPAEPASATYRHSRPSIAVLPFLEYDPAAEQSYFGDGLVEDVVAALAALPDLFRSRPGHKRKCVAGWTDLFKNTVVYSAPS